VQAAVSLAPIWSKPRSREPPRQPERDDQPAAGAARVSKSRRAPA
jgi:hypothetical protein